MFFVLAHAKQKVQACSKRSSFCQSMDKYHTPRSVSQRERERDRVRKRESEKEGDREREREIE